MFSDASDDESELDYVNLITKKPAWPYLQLHVEDEYEAKLAAAEKIYYKTRDGVDPNTIERDDYKIWRMLRFIHSIKGFYTGNLDLTGRHLPRFESLSKRWNTFLSDFINLSMTVEPYKVIVSGGYMEFTETHYTLKDLDIWDAFVSKWHVCYCVGYDGLIGLVQGLLEDLSQLPPVPNIQQLCLLDLPVELLDRIFSLSTVEHARSLSSACRKLRAIAKPYIFITRSLQLDFPPDFWKKIMGKEREEKIQMMVDAINASRSNLIKQAEFLLGRPDLLKVVGSLALGNSGLDIDTFETYGLDPLFGANFLEPVWKAFTKVISNCRNLRSLRLSTQISLSAEILQAITSLPHLVELSILGCIIPDEVVQNIFSGDITPSRSVLNLDLFDSPTPTIEIWSLIACFSNLRTLSVMHIGEQSLQPPILLSQVSNKVFASLERLSIGPVTNADIIDLTRWIELNSADAPLKLTHLKVSSNIGLNESFIFELVDALETAPLQVLVLDGINEGSCELFDRIAEKCQHLLGLTVMRRENSRQRECRAATWPHASWEYAPHFSTFKRLEHFTWNLRVQRCDQTPAGMRYFEDGFITDIEVMRRRMKGDDAESEDYFQDNHYLAYPFAAHCQTLKSFAIDGRSIDVFCYIKRLPNNQIHLQTEDIMLSSKKWEELEKWNTIRSHNLHWPHIIPRVNETL